MDNLEIWNKYKEVPSNALKNFDNGKFKGTDINTMWRIKCLTEQFGVCGIGWYYIPKKFWTEKCDNGDIFAFAEIELFVKENGEWSMPISGNGGNKLQRVKKDGDITTSDEAFKMAVTDALGVACRNLGFGADVYWANDKTKYTEYQEKPAFGGKYIFTSGSFKGKTIEQADAEDKEYLDKLLDYDKLDESIRKNIEAYKQLKEDVKL
jgi:hypothetical protein